MRECEIKLPITSSDEALALLSSLVRCGAQLSEARDELDLVLDSADFKMRHAGVLLRYRRVVTERSRVLVTLKTTKSRQAGSSWFQDHEEVEFFADDKSIAADRSMQIREEVARRAGLDLPDLSRPGTVFDWWSSLERHLGPLAVRSFVQKQRVVLRQASHEVGWEACLDRFPDPVGSYLELEAATPEKLATLIEAVGLPQERLDSRTYGQILAEKSLAATGVSTRICLFGDMKEELGDLLSRVENAPPRSRSAESSDGSGAR